MHCFIHIFDGSFVQGALYQRIKAQIAFLLGSKVAVMSTLMLNLAIIVPFSIHFVQPILAQTLVNSVSIENYRSYLPKYICAGALYPSAIIVIHKRPKHLFLCMHLQV